ncbi:hypothetical protein HID58_084911 [Brassica napus]|uniref:Cyclin-like domain-containing protein n=1 Tax=Brassica napus TaxID=3708 RepID=A0ABQ7XNU6_BRANA|nr:hypothetical protein HID58_084911 [Brassica napus]
MAEHLEQSILCTETTNVGDEEKGMIVDKNPISQMGFPSESEEIIREMMEKEKQHLPRDDYIKRLRSGDLDLNVRRTEALNWIWKACEEHHFGPLCVCLSVNYLDRFLSVHDHPNIDKAWTMQLLALACLSLAAKVEETEVPLLIDLQVGDPQFVFEAKSIQRMELLVLNRLEWRLRAITPCSYIRYFLRKMSKCDQEPSNTLISRSLQVIVSKTKGGKQVLAFWILDLLKLLLQWHFLFLEKCTQFTLKTLLFSHYFKRIAVEIYMFVFCVQETKQSVKLLKTLLVAGECEENWGYDME